MRNYFIIHGSDGNSQENWFPWMKGEIEAKGFECIVPDFPCKDGHKLSAWYEVIEKVRNKITLETVFISHSRGTAFILNLLTDFDYKIEALFMIGGFIENLWHKHGTPQTSFFAKPFNYEKIRSQCNRFIYYQSDNDPYIPMEHGEKVASILNARFELIHDAGHFNVGTKPEYVTFPILLKDVLR